VQNAMIPCRSQKLFPFLLYNLSFHPFPPTSLPSSLTSSCHLFLGLPLSLLFPNSYITLFWEFDFLPFSVHARTNVIYLTFRRKNQQHALIVPLLLFYVLAPTCFSSSLPSSGSLLDPPELLENTNCGLEYLKYITDNESVCVTYHIE
jgi:hypothetical protein